MQKKDFFNKLGLIDDRKLPQISSMDLLLLLLGVPFSYILPFIDFLFWFEIIYLYIRAKFIAVIYTLLAITSFSNFSTSSYQSSLRP